MKLLNLINDKINQIEKEVKEGVSWSGSDDDRRDGALKMLSFLKDEFFNKEELLHSFILSESVMITREINRLEGELAVVNGLLRGDLNTV